jgi:energy-coupling factor transport system ATP-binding protein
MPIVAKGLSYTYSPGTSFAATAVRDIDLTVCDGDFFGIIGHTGSGKSTLIQHFNGLIKLQSGSLTVDGIDLSARYDYKKLRANVGMVFQYPEYQLFDATVEKDVAFGPRNLGLSKEETAGRVREALTLVGLNYDEIKERSPFEISGGQKRRVALAGIIAMRPKYMVLDEPTAGLDPKGKAEILSLVGTIKQKTTPTIIMVSHNMDEIAANCNKVAVLSGGKLVSVTAAAELFGGGGEALAALGLDLPESAKIAERLRAGGYAMPPVFRKDELVREILKLWGRK